MEEYHDIDINKINEDYELLSGLNDEQKKAVKYIEGPQIISAGAGSGKTKVLTHKIAYLINHKKINPINILALTFTNKAANEIKERIKKLIGEFKVNGLVIGTFHSIFLKILKNHIFLLGLNYNKDFNIIEKRQITKMITNITKEYFDDFHKKKTLKKEDINYQNKLDIELLKEKFNKTVEYIIKKISNVQNEGISYEDYLKIDKLILEDEKKDIPFFKDVYRLYIQQCEKENVMDFDNILLNTYLLFKNNPKIIIKYQNMFRYILIDEYQDTNKVQFEIIKGISYNSNQISIVGDENQSIYKFRGSRIENIKDFKDLFHNIKIFKLQRNYRSTENIIKCASCLISHNKTAINSNLYTLNKSKEKIKKIKNANNYEESNKIAFIIKNMVEKEGCQYKDFCILYRANCQSIQFEKTFIDNDIPFHTYKKIGIFDSKIIKTIINYLQLIINPNNNTAFNYIINNPKRYIGKVIQNKFIESSKKLGKSCFDILSNLINEKDLNFDFNLKNKKTIESLESFYNLIIKYQNKLSSNSVYELTINLIDEINLRVGLKENDNNKIDTFLEKMNEMEKKYIFIYKKKYSLGEFLQEILLFVCNEEEINNGKNPEEKFLQENKVKLMTIHSSKGLEFNYIFIVGVEEGLYPSYKTNDEEEERRVFYVAITRAKKNCFISYSELNIIGKNSINEIIRKRTVSRFLFEIDESLMEDFEPKNYIYNDPPKITNFENEQKEFQNNIIENVNQFKINPIETIKIHKIRKNKKKREIKVNNNENNFENIININENINEINENENKEIKKINIKKKNEMIKINIDLPSPDPCIAKENKLNKKRLLKGQTSIDFFLNYKNK